MNQQVTNKRLVKFSGTLSSQEPNQFVQVRALSSWCAVRCMHAPHGLPSDENHLSIKSAHAPRTCLESVASHCVYGLQWIWSSQSILKVCQHHVRYILACMWLRAVRSFRSPVYILKCQVTHMRYWERVPWTPSSSADKISQTKDHRHSRKADQPHCM